LLKEFVIDWLLTFLFFGCFCPILQRTYEKPVREQATSSKWVTKLPLLYPLFQIFRHLFFQQCLHPAEKLMSAWLSEGLSACPSLLFNAWLLHLQKVIF